MPSTHLKVVSGPDATARWLGSAYGARFAGQYDEFVACTAPDIIAEWPGEPSIVPFAGRHHGREALRSVLQTLNGQFEHLDCTLVDIVVDGRNALVVRHVTLCARRTGAAAEFDIAEMLEIRDGEITRLTAFLDTASLALLAGWVSS